MFVMMGLFVGIINSVYAESVQCTQTCDAEHDGQKVYCDKKLYTCRSGDWEYFDIDAKGADLCEYSYSDRTWIVIDHRGEYSYDNSYRDFYMLRGELSVLPPNSFIDATTSFCIGCATNYYPAYDDASDREWYSCTGKEEALCLSHELHGQTTWMGAGEGCKCVEEGKVWNNNTFTCDDEVVEKPAQGEPTTETKCNVECDGTNTGKTIFCDGELYDCALNEEENVYKWEDVHCPNDSCTYTAYDQRDTSVFTTKIFENGLEAVYGRRAIANGTEASCDDICRGCKDFSDGNGNCFATAAQAECEWYAKQESVNVKWENDKCMCQASHQEWEDHSCPEDELVAFTDGDEDDTCNIICDNADDVYYCKGKVYKCDNVGQAPKVAGTDGTGWSDWPISIKDCEYTDPEHMNAGDKTYKSQIATLPTWLLYGTRVLKDGDKVVPTDFCMGCADNYYYADSACDDEEKAWCHWYQSMDSDQVDAGHHVEYNEKTGKCDCIGNDKGKVWDKAEHICKDEKDVKSNQTGANNTDTVNQAVKNVASFFENVENNKTVWRTAEGKFNTARLASDAIAGTVLGTVGGVVSAKVIKKKQLEKGYDVLNCSVGGQKMADWGDTFNVDLRR